MTLLKPLRYLTIRHGAKVVYDGVLPITLASGLTALLWWSSPGALFGKDGYLAGFQNMMGVLGGFFVAALTMVATGDFEILKAPVGGRRPPVIKGESAPLNRKRFLSYLFGYLATSSFCLVAIIVVATLVAGGISRHLAPTSATVVKWTGIALFNLWISHVFVTTLLGLYYFTERLSISDKRGRVGRAEAPPTPAE